VNSFRVVRDGRDARLPPALRLGEEARRPFLEGAAGELDLIRLAEQIRELLA